MSALVTQIAHGLVAIPVAFVAGWIGTRHNDRAAANARAGLAEMGAACPDEVEPCAKCEADAAAIDALNDDELVALARALGVYVDRAEMTADFDMWEEAMAR